MTLTNHHHTHAGELPPPRAVGRAQPAPTSGGDWCRIEASSAGGAESSADVYVYDEIGYWGTSAKDFAAQLVDLDVDLIRLHINSPGGNAWDGVAIMNALRRHRARVEVTVDGLAASAASLIAMAGDHIVMSRSATLMIHDAAGLTVGTATAMRETADILDKLSDSYADTYAKRGGGTRDEWRTRMRAETWYSAEEAVQAGLADEWDGARDSAAVASFDLSRFRFQGRAEAPAPVLTRNPPTIPKHVSTEDALYEAAFGTVEPATKRMNADEEVLYEAAFGAGGRGASQGGSAEDALYEAAFGRGGRA